MIAHVIAYNLLVPLRAIVADLQAMDGIDHVRVVDNASTYPPLLDWYADGAGGAEVVRRDENRGPLAAFQHVRNDDFFVVTDCDLDVSAVPRDACIRLREALERDAILKKAGLSLEIDDLPAGAEFDRMREWEAKYWQTAHSSGFWSADIDTTFAVYRPRSMWGGYGPAVRADRPYTARHLPWYWDPAALTDEQQYYLGQQSIGTWWTPRLQQQTRRA